MPSHVDNAPPTDGDSTGDDAAEELSKDGEHDLSMLPQGNCNCPCRTLSRSPIRERAELGVFGSHFVLGCGKEEKDRDSSGKLAPNGASTVRSAGAPDLDGSTDV